MPQELTVAYILQLKDICQYLSLNAISKDNIFKGKAIDERAAYMIYVEGKSVELRYAQNPNDPTLRDTANYLYSLLGRWGREAITILNNHMVALPIVNGPGNRTVNVGQNATFTVSVISAVPYTIQWYDSNNNPIVGATGGSYTFTNSQLTDSGKTFYVKATNSAGTVTSQIGVLVVQAQIVVFAWFGSTDPYPALSGGTDTLPYQITQAISHNAAITIAWSAGAANNQYQVVKVPITESQKTAWFNTALNQGSIPDSAFRAILVQGSFYYIVSRTAISLDGTTLTETFS